MWKDCIKNKNFFQTFSIQVLYTLALWMSGANSFQYNHHINVGAKENVKLHRIRDKSCKKHKQYLKKVIFTTSQRETSGKNKICSAT